MSTQFEITGNRSDPPASIFGPAASNTSIERAPQLPLLTLPVELRLRIWRLFLGPEDPVDPHQLQLVHFRKVLNPQGDKTLFGLPKRDWPPSAWRQSRETRKTPLPYKLAIFSVSKEIYFEAQDAFYKSNTFGFASPQDFEIFLSRPGLNPRRNRLLKKLVLGVYCLSLTHFIFTNVQRITPYGPGHFQCDEASVNKILRAWGRISSN